MKLNGATHGQLTCLAHRRCRRHSVGRTGDKRQPKRKTDHQQLKMCVQGAGAFMGPRCPALHTMRVCAGAFYVSCFSQGDLCAGLRERRWVFSERDSAQAARVPPPLDIPESRAAMRIKLARE